MVPHKGELFESEAEPNTVQTSSRNKASILLEAQLRFCGYPVVKNKIHGDEFYRVLKKKRLCILKTAEERRIFRVWFTR
ncbi:hypothetical protein M7I_2691 [Glarea lozoyensis 74030]|uniref:Uncharacterized protein n=1 Tax=Glarea lozoyensis (strain ATCC 74030 / MF5533) TaxID=1104152 RepID=H0EJG5_GLAL7|nr:hypothetical protein M7I_2691 [Glarea lozoyensis 74030]